MNCVDKELLERFLPEFIQVESKTQSDFVNQIEGELETFLEEFVGVCGEIEKLKKDEATEFNIFELMRYGHYETRLHTPFLFNLLSPDGTHGQQRLFFDCFIETFIPEIKKTSEITNICITEEKGIGDYGRIDILIELQKKGDDFVIIIENKINHYETKDQLSNYYQFLKNTFPADNYIMVLLNKRGTPPNIEFSITTGEYKELTLKGNLKIISYKRDVVSWLSHCRGKLKAPVLKNTLDQYLRTIKSF